jgi:hypothetical protein
MASIHMAHEAHSMIREKEHINSRKSLLRKVHCSETSASFAFRATVVMIFNRTVVLWTSFVHLYPYNSLRSQRVDRELFRLHETLDRPPLARSTTEDISYARLCVRSTTFRLTSEIF